MSYFSGHGYSEAFTEHMGELLASLTPDTPVCLTVGTDEVCVPCPHNRSGLCSKPELTSALDWEVLSLCGLGNGYILKFGDFMRLVEDNILAQGLREDICLDCEWDDLCAGKPGQWAAGN